jgi:hypothetical protein
LGCQILVQTLPCVIGGDDESYREFRHGGKN